MQLLKMKHLYSQKLHFQTYLPNSCKKVSFHQELLVLFWKMCDQNKVKCVFQMIIAPYSLRAMWPSDHASLIIFFFFSLLQKFLFYVLKSSDVLDILVPILYHLNDARSDQCKNASLFILPHLRLMYKIY